MADITGQISDSTADSVSYAVKTPAKESRVFIGAPDYRVFVWGIDITEDVYAVQITQQMDDQVGVCQVHIANDNLKWIMPTALSLVGYDFVPDELDLGGGDNENPLFNSNARSTNTTRFKRVTPVSFAKKKIENFKKSIGNNQKLGSAGESLLKQFSNSPNFPFLPGSSLFQMGDPIRVFLKNPWNLAAKVETSQIGDTTIEETVPQEEWYFAFTGYIASCTEDFDAQTNQSKLHLFCEDIRRLLRYMRTTTSPNVFNLNVAPDPLIGGSAQDFIKRVSGDSILVSGNAAMQAGYVLVQTTPDRSGPPGIVDALLFGDTGNRPSNRQVSDTEPGMQIVAGLLGFSPENKILKIIEGSEGGSQVEGQTSETLDQIYPVLTSDDVDRFGADWSLGAIPSVAPEPNRLFVILPSRLSFSSDTTLIWPYDWAVRIQYFSEFRSRLDIINEFVKAQDSIWYATPKGDIVLEFPQYDMIPQLHKKPWQAILQIQNEFTKFSLTEDDRNIKTLTIAQGSAAPGIDTRNIPMLAIAVKFNAELAARYGIREQRDSRPFKYSEEFIGTSLKSLAAMWQEMANADAYRLEGLEATPNFRAPIARPYFFKYRNMIGFCTTIHHQVVWGSLAQTVYEFKYLRHFDATSGAWQKISGQFGWYWARNPNPVRDDLGSGTRKQIFSSGGLDDRITQDPSSQILRDTVTDLRLKENLTGAQILSESDKSELENISTQLEKSFTDPTERQGLIDRVNQIMSRAKT